ncbi:zinc ABC transporter substrate-binding protein [Aciduricibacillus chroicocephali]|uniref:Zinc ABC transporter substrate-binding protein n=1 Tax=Aciduricibacillus chroicocephali TaxID=3054939 RepID=A0ABY9KT13_9BACI|nr:zinc ABC transporter substrate-binding protein [Bacillaceae bacterium 44XB]
MKKVLYMIAALMLPIIITAGCSGSKENNKKSSDQMDIYTSIYPLEYLAKQIGGDHVSVHSVYPPGTDAHTFEPTSKTVTDIAKSDGFIYMGAGMEGFAETTADALKNQDVHMLEIGKKASLFKKASAEEENEHEHKEHDGHDHGDKDPHIWLDPLKMIEIGEMVENNFAKWDPSHKKEYAANMNKLQKELTSLNADFSAELKNSNQQHILVSHAAYSYWERYGIEQISIRGLSSSDEPSQKELAKITRLAKEEKLHYVIYEKYKKDKLGQLIQKQIGAKALNIHNLEVLTQNDMDNHEDYMSLMRDNLSVLKKATQ